MPYKTDRKKLGSPFLDGRVKLLPCQKEMMPVMRERHGLSYRVLGEMFGVSKRMAMFICCPEKAEKAKEQYRERRKDGRYYDKEKHRVAMDNHRKKKYNLL